MNYLNFKNSEFAPLEVEPRPLYYKTLKAKPPSAAMVIPPKYYKKPLAGFTLIETILYLGLFAFLVGGGVVTAYETLESNNRSQTRAIMQGEGDFIIFKINWALSSIESVNEPSAGNSRSLLSVNKYDGSIGNVVINLTGNDIVLTRNSNSAVLNNSNVSVSDLVFDHKKNNNAEFIKATFTLTSKTAGGITISDNFETTKYLIN